MMVANHSKKGARRGVKGGSSGGVEQRETEKRSRSMNGGGETLRKKANSGYENVQTLSSPVSLPPDLSQIKGRL